MITALAEGITQSLLPCSWTLLTPAIALGLGTRNMAVLGLFTGTVILTAWTVVAGWFVAPVWLAGAALLLGGLLWWRLGPIAATAVAVGVGSAWAWRPCVGPQLGQALTTAQHNPLVALGGLSAFLLGVIVIGVATGLAAGVLGRRLVGDRLEKAGAAVAMVLGLTMVLGIYPKVASTLAQWSTALWA